MTDTATTIQDTFSWRRVAMTGAAWWPRLRWEVFFAAGAAITVGLLGGLIDRTFKTYVGNYMITSIFSMVICFFPAVFGMASGRNMMRLLPASNREKGVFMLLFSIVFIPLLYLVLAEGTYYIFNPSFYSTQFFHSALQEAHINDSSFFYFLSVSYNFVYYLCLIMGVLFLSQWVRKNAVLKSIVIPIGICIVIGFIIGISSAVAGFIDSLNSIGDNGLMDAYVVIDKTMNVIKYIMIAMMMILFCALSVMVTKFFSAVGRSIG